MFIGRKIIEFTSESGIKLLTFTPYYAQGNGQVKTTNKIIIGLIKKHVGQKPKNWPKTLDQSLWLVNHFIRRQLTLHHFD